MKHRPGRLALAGLREEAGAGSVLAVGVMGALVALLLATLPVATLLTGHQRAANAADAAAVTAADTRYGRVGGFPGETARIVACRHPGTRGACTLEGATVGVVAIVETPLGTITVAARAGPPPDASGRPYGAPGNAPY